MKNIPAIPNVITLNIVHNKRYKKSSPTLKLELICLSTPFSTNKLLLIKYFEKLKIKNGAANPKVIISNKLYYRLL